MGYKKNLDTFDYNSTYPNLPSEHKWDFLNDDEKAKEYFEKQEEIKKPIIGRVSSNPDKIGTATKEAIDRIDATIGDTEYFEDGKTIVSDLTNIHTYIGENPEEYFDGEYNGGKNLKSIKSRFDFLYELVGVSEDYGSINEFHNVIYHHEADITNLKNSIDKNENEIFISDTIGDNQVQLKIYSKGKVDDIKTSLENDKLNHSTIVLGVNETPTTTSSGTPIYSKQAVNDIKTSLETNKLNHSAVVKGMGETSTTSSISVYSQKAVDDKIGNMSLWNGVSDLTSAVNTLSTTATNLDTNKLNYSAVQTATSTNETKSSNISVYSKLAVDEIKTSIDDSLSTKVSYNDIKSSITSDVDDSRVYSAKLMNSILGTSILTQLSGEKVGNYLVNLDTDLTKKLNVSEIASTTGTGTSIPMSQKITTDELNKKFEITNIVSGTSTSTDTDSSGKVYSTERMNKILTTKVNTNNIVTSSGTEITTNDQIYCASVVNSLLGTKFDKSYVVLDTTTTIYTTSQVYCAPVVHTLLGNKLNHSAIVLGTNESPNTSSSGTSVYSQKAVDDKIGDISFTNLNGVTNLTSAVNTLNTNKVNTSDILTSTTGETDTKVYSASLTKTLLDTKVDKTNIIKSVFGNGETQLTPADDNIYSALKVDSMIIKKMTGGVVDTDENNGKIYSALVTGNLIQSAFDTEVAARENSIIKTTDTDKTQDDEHVYSALKVDSITSSITYDVTIVKRKSELIRTATDSNVTISVVGNTDYTITAAFTKLTINDVPPTVGQNGVTQEDVNLYHTLKMYEANIYFTTGNSITVDIPNTIKTVGVIEFSPNTSYVISIVNNIMVVGECVSHSGENDRITY